MPEQSLLSSAPARGMRDLLPAEVALRDWATAIIVSTYEKFGFTRVETPALENIGQLRRGEGGENLQLIFEVLKRGDKLDKELAGGNVKREELADLGLRFDLTVPLVRFYANNQNSLPNPFKAIQIGSVWRAESPQAGRFRQFTQCDIDMIGVKAEIAEMELLQATAEALLNLSFRNFTIRINDRRILSAIVEACGFEKESHDVVFITLDKLDKIGIKGITSELESKGNSTEVVGNLKTFLEKLVVHFGEPGKKSKKQSGEHTGDKCDEKSDDNARESSKESSKGSKESSKGSKENSTEDSTENSNENSNENSKESENRRGDNPAVFALVNELLSGSASNSACCSDVEDADADKNQSETGRAFTGLQSIIKALEQHAGGRFNVTFDPTLVRGMGYYTGPIFEFATAGYSYSIAGGGRYDKMIGKFSGRDIPACGCSIGFERIIGVLTDQNFETPQKTNKIAVIYNQDRDELVEVIVLANQLRESSNEGGASQVVSLLPRKKEMRKQLDQLVAQGFTGYVAYQAGQTPEVKPLAGTAAQHK